MKGLRVLLTWNGRELCQKEAGPNPEKHDGSLRANNAYLTLKLERYSQVLSIKLPCGHGRPPLGLSTGVLSHSRRGRCSCAKSTLWLACEDHFLVHLDMTLKDIFL